MKAGAENAALAKAMQYLGAVEVAPGWYAFQGSWPNEKRWFVTDETQIIDRLGRILDKGYTPTTSWCYENFMGHMMPTWWSPEQRFASFDGGKLKATGSTKAAATLCDTSAEAPVYGAPLPYRVVTADLTTGEEVPA